MSADHIDKAGDGRRRKIVHVEVHGLQKSSLMYLGDRTGDSRILGPPTVPLSADLHSPTALHRSMLSHRQSDGHCEWKVISHWDFA